MPPNGISNHSKLERYFAPQKALQEVSGVPARRPLPKFGVWAYTVADAFEKQADLPVNPFSGASLKFQAYKEPDWQDPLDLPREIAGGGRVGHIRNFTYANDEQGQTREINHTSYIFRFPVQYGKLPGFLKEHPEFDTIELPAASTAQTALGLAMTLKAAGLYDRFKVRRDRSGNFKQGGIVATDKYQPSNMLISQHGLVSSAELYNDNPDQFSEMARHWDNIRNLVRADFPDSMTYQALKDIMDRTILPESEYRKYRQKYAATNQPSLTGSVFSTPNAIGWDAARQREQLFSIRTPELSRLLRMINFEIAASRTDGDLAGIIKDNPHRVKGPRLIVMQSVVHLMTPDEREELIDALKSLPKGSVILLGTNEYEPYRGEEFAERFFDDLFEQTSFRPVDDPGSPLKEKHRKKMPVLARMDQRSELNPELVTYKLPGGYIKMEDDK